MHTAYAFLVSSLQCGPGTHNCRFYSCYLIIIRSMNLVAITLHCTIIIVTSILAILVATWNFSS